jgi:ribosomal protein L7Ae-like RNA K-turn-binding protein
VDAADQRRLLGLLGLGIRGRNCVVGVDRVREAAHNGSLRVAVMAADAARNSREKVEGLIAAKGIPLLTISSAADLGEVAGRETTTIIGVVDVQLAKGILALAGSAGAVRKGSRGTV